MSLKISVDKSGGDFTCLQEAINAVPFEESAEIFVGEGVFREKIFCEKKNITLVGAGMDKTVINFDDYANEVMEDGSKRGTFRSYTAFFGGGRVHVKDMTIRNSAGDGRAVGQAVAVYADAEVCFFENVKLTGCQDTLFCAPLPRAERQAKGFMGPRVMTERKLTKQYYKSCVITGDVDFIFGGADAVFDDCTITCNDRMHSGFTADVSLLRSALSSTNSDKWSIGTWKKEDAPAKTDVDGVAGKPGKADAPAKTDVNGATVNPGKADAPAKTDVDGAAVNPGKADAPAKLDKDQIDTAERFINGYITATCGRKEDLGFVFRNCRIGGAPGCEPGSVFLGRPWRDEARTVFFNCEMDETIAPERFSGWGGITKEHPDTFYGEFGTRLAEAANGDTETSDGYEKGISERGRSESADGSASVAARPADLSRKNPWVQDIDEALAAELNRRADEVVAVCLG